MCQNGRSHNGRTWTNKQIPYIPSNSLIGWQRLRPFWERRFGMMPNDLRNSASAKSRAKSKNFGSPAKFAIFRKILKISIIPQVTLNFELCCKIWRFLAKKHAEDRYSNYSLYAVMPAAICLRFVVCDVTYNWASLLLSDKLEDLFNPI